MNKVYNKTVKLFNDLHLHPEISLKEVSTKRILMDFISINTSFEIYDLGSSFCAFKRFNESDDNIAFRADMDAVRVSDDMIGHYCGHDGHSATLAGFLLLIDNYNFDKNIYAIFQSAEETGEGAKELSAFIKDNNIKEIYGYHNIPGYKLGKILLKKGTFACASTGMSIHFNGLVSHAAYPSSGKNPSFAVSKLIEEIEKINAIEREYIEFITVVGVKMGDRNFGVSLGDAEVNITLRSEREDSLNEIVDYIIDKTNRLAMRYDLTCDVMMVEPFPETRNYDECVAKLENICIKRNLEYQYLNEPMHWSEDFGYYLKATNGAFIGVGNGDTSDLHTIDYSFDYRLMIKVWMLYLELL